VTSTDITDIDPPEGVDVERDIVIDRLSKVCLCVCCCVCVCVTVCLSSELYTKL